MIKPDVDISLSESKKTETNPFLYKQKLVEIKQSKHPAVEIYTDGSKDKIKVAAAAAVSNHDVFSVRLPDEATILTAEAKAIQLAFELIKISKDTYFTIFSDSLSCLQSIHNMNIDHPYILYILCNCLHASRQGKIGISFGFQATLEFTAIVKPIALQNLHSSLKL